MSTPSSQSITGLHKTSTQQESTAEKILVQPTPDINDSDKNTVAGLNGRDKFIGIEADNKGPDGCSGSADESLGVDSDSSDADESDDDAPPVWVGYSSGARAKPVKNVVGPSTNIQVKPTSGGPESGKEQLEEPGASAT